MGRPILLFGLTLTFKEQNVLQGVNVFEPCPCRGICLCANYSAFCRSRGTKSFIISLYVWESGWVSHWKVASYIKNDIARNINTLEWRIKSAKSNSKELMSCQEKQVCSRALVVSVCISYGNIAYTERIGGAISMSTRWTPFRYYFGAQAWLGLTINHLGGRGPNWKKNCPGQMNNGRSLISDAHCH